MTGTFLKSSPKDTCTTENREMQYRALRIVARSKERMRLLDPYANFGIVTPFRKWPTTYDGWYDTMQATMLAAEMIADGKVWISPQQAANCIGLHESYVVPLIEEGCWIWSSTRDGRVNLPELWPELRWIIQNPEDPLMRFSDPSDQSVGQVRRFRGNQWCEPVELLLPRYRMRIISSLGAIIRGR